jgi:hypothetical protein
MLHNLILIDTLSSSCWEKKEKKKKKEKQPGGCFFSQGWRLDTPCWLCWAEFSWLLGASKG